MKITASNLNTVITFFLDTCQFVPVTWDAQPSKIDAATRAEYTGLFEWPGRVQRSLTPESAAAVSHRIARDLNLHLGHGYRFQRDDSADRHGVATVVTMLKRHADSVGAQHTETYTLLWEMARHLGLVPQHAA